MKLRRIYQLPYLGILVWPFIYSAGLLLTVPCHMFIGMWRGFNEGGERINYFLFKASYRPWELLPNVWKGYKLTLSRKHRMFPNGIDHMRRRIESK